MDIRKIARPDRIVHFAFVAVVGGLLSSSVPALSQQEKRTVFKFEPPAVNAEVLGSRQNLDASILLTKLPRGMFLDGDTGDIKEVAWTPNDVACVVRYGPRPGNRDVSKYPNRFSAEGSGTIRLNPAQDGVRTGHYYCILVAKDDPAITSVEFTVIVQANASPIARAPLGNVNLQQGTPLFQWDRVGGVPYYFLFLSEGPIAIERNDEGEVTGLTGLNLTWQAITTATFIKYGDPDPSGNFPVPHVPPLLPGIRYNWIVLNAYGPSIDMVSGEVAPLAPAFFEVNRPTISPSPTLTQPAADAALADEEILFEWSSVPGATRYRFFLYETGDFSDNLITYTMWSQVTTENQLRLAARNLLVRTGYHWRVVAENTSGLSASERRPFRYTGAAGWARFFVSSLDIPLSRATITIKDQADGATLLPAITDTFGVVKVPLPSASYSYRVSRPGFLATAPANFTVPNDDTISTDVEMVRGLATVSGQIVDNSGQGLFDATIELRSGAQQENISSNATGYFSLSLTPGNWSYRVLKDGFVETGDQSFLQPTDETVDLGQIMLQVATNRVTGQVAFANDGRPLQGAFLRTQKDDIIFETTTNNTGGFSFTLGPGRWKISLNSQGFVANPPDYTFDLTDNQQVPASFQLAAGGIVNGRVTFQERGLDNALVRAFRKSDGGLVQTANANSQGVYSIGLPAGDYSLAATRQNFLEIRRDITIVAGQTLAEDFALTEAGFVEGRVINLETASPVAGAKVFVVEDTTLHTFSNGNGDYFLSVPPNTLLQIDAVLSGFDSNGPFSVSAGSGETIRQDFFLQALSGVVRGRVTDGFAPIAGALVEIAELERQELTDNQGLFEFTIPPGEYNIEVSKDCHFSKFVTVNLVAGITEDLDITLEALQSVVTGRVSDAGGLAISGAQVSASGDTVFTTLTNDAGNYQLCLNEGIFRITASQLGFTSSSRTLVISEGDSIGGINFILQDDFARVSGTVVDTLNQPVVAAKVTLTNANQTLSDTTDENGNYSLERIIPGLSDISATKANFYGITISRFLGGQQQLDLDLTLYPADGFISGTVRDSQTEDGIAGVTVSAEFSLNSDEFFSTLTDAAGNYTISSLPVISNATFTVFAFKEEYFSPTPIAEVDPKATGVDFLLVNRTGTIKGTVRDRDTSEPIAGARVEATNTSGARRQAFSNPDGAFTISGLVPSGFYNVAAARSGFFTETSQNVEPGDTSVVLNMLRRYGFVEGRIVDFSSNASLANVPVLATPVGVDGRETAAITDANGGYRLKLIADFYAVQPMLSHYRNEPREQQVEVTEVDTVRGIDFSLESQSVQTITISRADQSPDPEISNLAEIRFVANATDLSNRPVNIGRPQWRLDVSRQAAAIDSAGLLKPRPTFFGDINITATDAVSRKQGILTVRVFAAIDSTTSMTLFNDRGLQIVIGRGSVLSNQKLLVSKEAMAPAKRGRAELFSADSSYILKDATLTFNHSVRLSLPSPPNSDDLQRFVGRWDPIENVWEKILSVVNSNRVEADITKAGEYTALALSKDLAIENLTLLPNPFSPFQVVDGRNGLKIQFDLSSNVAPTPLLTVKIYNLEGNLVRLLHDQTPFQRGPTNIYWDGRADDGALARNGRYLVRLLVEDPSGSKDVMKSVVLIK